MATYGNALANPVGGGSVGNNNTTTSMSNNTNDPFLQNDFYPLQLASSEILTALRADESATDADLYRRLISSSGVGAHRYHRVEGDGLGGTSMSSASNSNSSSSSSGGNNSSSNDGGASPSSSSSSKRTLSNNPMRMGNNAIGSPLGVLRGTRQFGSTNSSSSSSNTSPPSDQNQQRQAMMKLAAPSQPPTPYLQHDRSIPLPTQLANETKKAKLSSLMGLLPEANLVWVTSDDKLFLWSYNSSSNNGGGSSSGDMNNGATTTTTTNSWGRNTPKQSSSSATFHTTSSSSIHENYCSFTVPSGQCIVSVGLVRPKSNNNVFTKLVEWCIVVTTPEEVILCALTNESGDYGDEQEYQQQPQSADNGGTANCDTTNTTNGSGGFRHGNNSIMRLIPTRFILPTDSIPLTSICGSREGRIFMGGVDGCVYEMTYEGNSNTTTTFSAIDETYLGGSDAMERAIDDYFDGRGIFTLSNGDDNNGGMKKLSEQVLVGGKRVLSALTFGSLDSDSYGEQRRSKCRKINHSSVAPGLVASVVPGAIVRAASGIFASGSESAARKGGPIVSMIMDEERLCLYTLSSKGVICAYDLSPLPNATGSNSTSSPPQGDFNSAVAVAPPRLACVFNAVASAKLYLDSVSRGRMYPPSTSQSVELGIITFPGGNASAQAGVGGMDGARAILKRHDQEMRLVKASSAGSSSKAVQNEMSNSGGILHPVSIHLVPGTESKSLTLVAVTGGGLRYYLSSLASNYINLAQSNQGGFDYSMRGLDPKLARTRPSTKMTFCHIRAPPPYTSGNGNDGFHFELAPSAVNLLGSLAGGASVGIPPGIHDLQSVGSANVAGAVGDVVKSFYGNGMFVLALDVDKGKPSSSIGSSRGNSFTTPSSEKVSRKPVGDAIVTVLPDFAARVVDSLVANNTSKNLSLIAAGGISESISLPMTGYDGNKSPVLPGGRTFDISTKSNTQSSLVSLFMNSETPSDGELQIGLTPSFVPQKVYQRRNSQSNGTSSSLVVLYDRGSGVISSALSVLSNYIRSGQGYGFEVGTVASDPTGLSPSMSYRISLRHGCDSSGFSRSSEEVATTTRNGLRGKSTPRSTNKSERLPPWMLRPSAAPLNCQAVQHLNPPGTGTTLVLNAGGLHIFNISSLLNNFASALLRATNVPEDGTIRNFFVSYGYAEGCAMCFALATSSSSSETLRSKARQAAFCYGRSPEMKLTGPSNGDDMDPMSSFTFQPSSLYEGLVKFMSRLLRPFWYKPAVVVTEGRPIQSKSAYANYYARLPAKVELLLDDITLDEIRRPLVLLQELMKSNFDAVKTIPGVSQRDSSDQMDVDDGDGSAGLITRVMQNQSRAFQLASNSSQTQYASDKERKEKAFKTEDRNMHSIYRLLSRSVQVLNLLSCLKQAHSMSTLPEVQWGLIHGLTFYQLVTSQEGQQRIETLLNALVSQGDKTLLTRISQDGDRLAHTLSRQCYLFFSSASRLTYLGFKAANDALSRPTSSPQRGLLANKAAAFLRAASRHWYDPALVAGRTNRMNSSETWVDIANGAFDAGSPLARAAEVLVELGEVEGLVDMCLICGANFGGVKVPRNDRKELEEEAANAIMEWEKGLYHRPATGPSGDSVDPRSSGTQSIVSGMDVTPADALKTCHGILFYYMSKLLIDGPANQRLAESLVAVCASSSDAKFLHAMYEHLLSTNQVETALRIDSTSLEDWLINEKKDSNLLWRYYSFHGRHFSAGEIMLKKALDPAEKVPLAQRIECLTRAANSYSSALERNLPSSNMMRMIGGYDQRQDRALQERQVSVETLKSNIKMIEEKLDIAKIQQRVLTTVDQSQNVDLESDKVDALRFKLVSVSDLYNDYTCPLNLFDVCLLILNTCRYNDRDNIETLWKSVICEEILPCQTTSALAISFLTQLKQGSTLEEETVMQSGDYGNDLQSFDNGEWMPRLRSRVSTLGKELYGKGADYTVPLDLIVQALEGLRQAYSETHKENKLSQPWPIETMLNVGVSFDALYQSYDSLYLEADGDIDATIRLHWLSSIQELLKMWVKEAFSNYDSAVSSQGGSASSQLAQAVKNGGLLDRIKAYNSSIDGLFEGNSADIDEVKSGFNEVEEAIRKGF